MNFNLKIFTTLFLAVFSTTTGVGIVVPLLPLYAHELGAGAFQIGLIFGAFSLSRSLFVPYFGRLSDIKGKKPFLTRGLFLYFISSICFLFSTNVTSLILIRLGQGFASAMILPVAQAYVGIITPKNREGFTMGLFNLSLFGGLSIGPLLGGLVRDWFSIRFSFLSMAALTLFAFVVCQILLPSEKEPGKTGSPVLKRSTPYLKIMKDPAIFPLFAFRVCFTTIIGITWAFLPLLARSRMNLSSSAIGTVIMINVLIGGLFQVPLGFLADRFSKKLLITIGGILSVVSVFYINAAGSFKQLFLANGLFGLAMGVSFPAVMALGVIEGRRLNAMGSTMGLLAMAHSIGMLAGPLTAGILLDLYSFRVVFAFGILILSVGTLVLLCLYRPSD